MPYENPVPRELRATPERCGHLAERLSAALASLERAGGKVSDGSRLRRSVRILNDTAANGVMPDGDVERRRLANALRSAYDLGAIAALLPPNTDEAVLGDVAIVTKGTIDESEPERRPYQFQSRLWFQAVFHGGGLLTRALPTDQPGPDFLIELETGTTYGIEVKRPEKESTVGSNIEKAVDQLADFGLRGGIAIDLSDCLQAASVFRLTSPPTDPPYAAIDPHFARLYRSVGDELFDRAIKQPRPGKRHVFFAAVVARGWCWPDSENTPPELYTSSQFGLFVSAKGNLLYHHADHIRDHWEAGLKQTGLFFSRVTSDPG